MKLKQSSTKRELNINLTEPHAFHVEEFMIPYPIVEIKDEVLIEDGSIYTRQISLGKEDNYTPYERLTLGMINEFNEGDFDSLKLKWSLQQGDIDINGVEVSLDVPERVMGKLTENTGSLVYVGNSQTFNLQNIIKDEAQDMERILNRSILSQKGLQVEFYHVRPDLDNGIEHTFNEYISQNVKAKECINIVLPNDELPEIDPTFAEFGIEFNKFFVHIDKEEFESIFGEGERVTNESFFYVKEYNRLYTIVSCKLERGVKGQSTYYEAHVRAYDDNLSVNKGEFEQELDDMTYNADDLFGQQNRDAEKDAVNPIQASEPSRDNDMVRENIASSMQITEELVYNHGNEIIGSYYNLDTVARNTVAVLYREELNSDDLSITNWMKVVPAALPEINFANCTYSRSKTTEVVCKSEENHFLEENDLVQEGQNTYLVTEIVDDKTFVIASTVIPKSTRLDLQKPSYVYMIKSETYDFAIAIDQESRGMFIIYNGQVRSMRYAFAVGTWVGLIAIINSKRNYLEVEPFTLQTGTGVLKSLNKYYLKDFQIDGIKGGRMMLTGSNLSVSNVRVWSKPIPDEIRQSTLNSRFINKASKALIVDNAEEPRLYDEVVNPSLNRNPQTE